MTPAQIALVQNSFRQVVPIQDTAARLFYGRLFEIDPGTQSLFGRTDMAEQGRKLMATLGVVVAGLSQPATIIPAAEALARRHVGYGVTEAQYASVGAALLWTLGQGLGEAFTPEVAASWAAAYAMVAAVMLAATRGGQPVTAAPPRSAT